MSFTQRDHLHQRRRESSCAATTTENEEARRKGAGKYHYNPGNMSGKTVEISKHESEQENKSIGLKAARKSRTSADNGRRGGTTLPASEELVRFLPAGVGATAGAGRMRLVGCRPALLRVWRLSRRRRRRHGLAIGRVAAGVRGGGVDALSKRQARRPEKNAESSASH